MSVLSQLFKSRGPDLAPLYGALVAAARRPGWYRQGRVPDTLDGRFDMLAALVSLALMRLERDGVEGNLAATRLTETFVHDMDGQLREQGVGDVVVGKHIGKMVSALGGRLTAYRAALKTEGEVELSTALVRNLYRGEDPGAEPLAYVTNALRLAAAGMESRPVSELLTGKIA